MSQVRKKLKCHVLFLELKDIMKKKYLGCRLWGMSPVWLAVWPLGASCTGLSTGDRTGPEGNRGYVSCTVS